MDWVNRGGGTGARGWGLGRMPSLPGEISTLLRRFPSLPDHCSNASSNVKPIDYHQQILKTSPMERGGSTCCNDPLRNQSSGYSSASPVHQRHSGQYACNLFFIRGPLPTSRLLSRGRSLSASNCCYDDELWQEFRAIDYCCKISPFSCVESKRINCHRLLLLARRLLKISHCILNKTTA